MLKKNVLLCLGIFTNAVITATGVKVDIPIWIIASLWTGFFVAAIYEYKGEIKRAWFWLFKRKEISSMLQLQNLKEAINSLSQKDLGNGIKCAKLPDGTTVVTMPDGEIKLAFPVRIAVHGTSRAGMSSAGVTVVKGDKDDS